MHAKDGREGPHFDERFLVLAAGERTRVREPARPRTPRHSASGGVLRVARPRRAAGQAGQGLRRGGAALAVFKVGERRGKGVSRALQRGGRGAMAPRPVLTSLTLQAALYFGKWYDVIYFVLSFLIFLYKVTHAQSSLPHAQSPHAALCARPECRREARRWPDTVEISPAASSVRGTRLPRLTRTPPLPTRPPPPNPLSYPPPSPRISRLRSAVSPGSPATDAICLA